jgi:hypothetical protein
MKDMNIYLVASYAAKPRDPKMTSVKGYMTNPANVQFDEQVNVSRGIKRQAREKAAIVLDLTNLAVVKNRFGETATFESLIKHYMDGYGDYINQSVKELNRQIGL